MFAELQRYRCIIVTGPQRSGTTIAARMIAHDTGHTCIDEADYGTKDIGAWREIVRTADNVVVHSPAMSRWVHEEAAADVLVVWMLRSLSAILRSQQRIGWKSEIVERAKYEATDDAQPVAEIKLDYWRTHQRAVIPHWLEVDYETLRDHPLWVIDRQDWEARQWAPRHCGDTDAGLYHFETA